MSLRVVPTSLKEANQFVARRHRHHGPTRGHKFSVGLERDGELIGIAITGRPVAPGAQAWPTPTAEILRVCVADDVANACSKLYGACRRAAVAMGYTRVITYTLASESGTSLRAGFRADAHVPGRPWDCPSRPRNDAGTEQPDKVRWVWP